MRSYRDDDWDTVYDMCVRTADSGELGLTGWFSRDSLVPDIWAGTYLSIQPDLVFLLETGGQAIGYVLGTAHTESFVERYRHDWLPRISPRYDAPAPEAPSLEAHLTSLLLHPETMLIPEINFYPAHLHINILAGYRHAGGGRRLIQTFTTAATERGASSRSSGRSGKECARTGVLPQHWFLRP